MANTILGQMQTASTCPACGGLGRSVKSKPKDADEHGLRREETVVEIEIPAGVEDGMQLNLRGKGNAAPAGGMAGDLLVQIREVDHEFFTRNSRNLHLDHYVSFVEATLGAQIEIPLLQGKAKIRVEPGTQSGKILCQAQGIALRGQLRQGHLQRNLNAPTPQELSSKKGHLGKGREAPNFQLDPTRAEGLLRARADMFS